VSDDVVDQLKKVQVSKLTLGLIGSIVFVSAVVTWNAAQLASRIDNLETSVAAIEVVDTSNLVTTSQLLAAIHAIPVPEPVDLSHLATTDDLEDLQDAVTELAAMEPEWVDDIEEIEQRLEEIGWELGDLWWRTDLSEQACRTRLWCDKWYDENW
tara:strand:- start:99 stop:563 length:465 start_codon:yes stop_codon:yes gene_type:complete